MRMEDLAGTALPLLRGEHVATLIETPRLKLRIPQEADLDEWFALLADPQSSQFIGGPMTRHQAWGTLAVFLGHWALRGFGPFSLVLRSSGLTIGWAGPWFPDGWPGREVGCVLRKEYWGQGLATEATTAAVQWVRQVLKWHDVIHCIDPNNSSAIALASRLGSSFIRTERLRVLNQTQVRERHIYGQKLQSTTANDNPVEHLSEGA